MTRGRWIIIGVGVLLPYLARLPGSVVRGPSWIGQYLPAVHGFELMTIRGVVYFGLTTISNIAYVGAFNAVAWGAILGTTFTFNEQRLAWLPALVGFSYLANAHARLDVAADPQNPIALIFIPPLRLEVHPRGLAARACGRLCASAAPRAKCLTRESRKGVPFQRRTRGDQVRGLRRQRLGYVADYVAVWRRPAT